MRKQNNFLDLITNEKSFNLTIVFVVIILFFVAGLWQASNIFWSRFSDWAGKAAPLLAISLALNIVVIPILLTLIGKAYLLGESKAQDYKAGIDTGVESTAKMMSNIAKAFSRTPQVTMIEEQNYLPPPPDITIIGD